MSIDLLPLHHETALAVAAVAQTRTEHPELAHFAATLAAADGAEFDHLRTWREAWFGGAPMLPMDRMMLMMGAPIERVAAAEVPATMLAPWTRPAKRRRSARLRCLSTGAPSTP